MFDYFKKVFKKKYSTKENLANEKNIYIYGAGGAGKELYDLFEDSKRYKCVAFIDNNPDKQKNSFCSLEVLSPKTSYSRLSKDNIKEVWMAMANIDSRNAQKIAKKYKSLGIEVKSIPGFSSLLLNEEKPFFDSLPLSEVLDRDYDVLDSDILRKEIYDHSILVTGSGGSIGSELCRIVVESSPKRIVLLDSSEIALFEIERELRTICNDKKLITTIVPILGSATDKNLLKSLVDIYEIDIVFHAAAYKHVRLVELNIIEGISNNIFSTKSIVDVVKNSNVKYCVLVSSDKAVNPKNVMGATKRFSELLFQDAAENSSKCIFTSVRFGNVLGSSGSVIPIFKNQILSGGPVTVTHKEMTRYFMSIEEAASLTISTLGLAKGGEVFVLDMGKPVKILDLAKKLITLLGNSNDKNDPNFIPIKFIGMLKGEKLHEELIISGEQKPTVNPKIFKATEPKISSDELEKALSSFEVAIEELDEELAYEHLINCFPSILEEKDYS